MPPTSLLKDLTKCKHPNSRRTKALAKKAKRFNNRDKIKFGHAARSNVLGEKFTWFLEQIGDRKLPPTPEEFDEMISLYLKRFDDEVEQIEMKQSISKNRAHQHFSRLNAIKITIEKESAEYNGGGFEFIDLCDPEKFKQFTLWDGNSMNVQHFKMQRVSKKRLIDSSMN